MRHLCNSNKSTIEEQQKLYGAKMWSQVFLTQPNMTSEGLHRLIRQQAITRANVDTDLCRHMASLGHNELIKTLLVL